MNAVNTKSEMGLFCTAIVTVLSVGLSFSAALQKFHLKRSSASGRNIVPCGRAGSTGSWLEVINSDRIIMQESVRPMQEENSSGNACWHPGANSGTLCLVNGKRKKSCV